MPSDSFYGSNVPSAAQYVSRVYHASAVLGDWVYVDGGELIYNIVSDTSGGGKTAASGSQKWELLNRTLALDLSTSWSNASVTFKTINRGARQLLNSGCLWPNAQGDALYNFAGEISFWVAWPNISHTQPPSLWRFVPDNVGGGIWTVEDTAGSLFPSISPTGGLQTSGNGVGYYLGGDLDFTTYPQLPFEDVISLQGLTEFNSSTGAWSNLTSTEVYTTGNPELYSGQASYGAAHFVPTFGPEGVVVFFGVRPPVLNPFWNATYAGSMTQLSVFEPLSQTWYNQTAAGPSIPDWRADFCTTGVAGDDGTYQIIMHGGTKWVNDGPLNTSDTSPLAAGELALDQVYMLSLPSFAWFQAQYAPIQSRAHHTCHAVGSGRQLLTIGGVSFNQTSVPGDFAEQDAFAQGLGVFDLTDLKWMPSYDAHAEPYRTPQMIKEYIAASGPTPSTWEDPRLAQVFATSRAASSTSSAAPTSTSRSSHSSSPVGAIAGGVVGGVVGLILLVVVGFLLFRRRQKAKRPPAGGEKPADARREEIYKHHELTADNVQELKVDKSRGELRANDQGLAWELEAQRAPGELEAREHLS